MVEVGEHLLAFKAAAKEPSFCVDFGGASGQKQYEHHHLVSEDLDLASKCIYFPCLSHWLLQSCSESTDVIVQN